ncbi:MAG: septum formation family protein [Actinomycetota bacterium]|nr:septum formation family protein [Actinomycetota bacterium]
MDSPRSDLETPAAAATSSSERSPGGSWSRLPTWLLFVLVFVGGSIVVIAGVTAIAVVVGSIVDGLEDLSAAGDSGAVATTVATVPAGGEEGLLIGQCLDEDELDKYLDGDDYSVVSCDDPHDTEIYYRHQFAAGPYPGDETVTDELKGECRSAFEGYVGIDYESSALSFWVLWPTQGAWETGNLLGECALFDPETNALRGSAYESGW